MMFSYLLNLEDIFDFVDNSDDTVLIILALILSVSITGHSIDGDLWLVVSCSDFYILSLLNNFSLTTIFSIITSTAINIDYVSAFYFHSSYFI